MKKDYIPLAGTSSKEETAFVEDYWTQIWDGYSLEKFTKSRIEGREEFKVMEPYISRLPPKARILDGGCGLGEWTLYYSFRGFDVVGLDISRKTIERLGDKFPNHGFIAGDIRSTEFDDGYFDIYFSWGVFEHFEIGFGPCLREARRVLKQGGYLFITVPFQNSRHLRNIFQNRPVTAFQVIHPWPSYWLGNLKIRDRLIKLMTQTFGIQRDQWWLIQKLEKPRE